MKLRITKRETIDKIATKKKRLKEIENSILIKEYLKEIEMELETVLDTNIVAEFRQETVYQENDFSVGATKSSILKAKINAISYLDFLIDKLENSPDKLLNKYMDEFSEETTLNIISKILNNFYCHIEEMYEAHVHGRAHITREKLEEIKIGNEYDVQRILYSIIKPIFPEARLEVSEDTGYGSIRYDIIIEKYSVVIEVKCSRSSMTERTLTEEIGSDAFHYKYSNIFFFLYDKDKIVKNKTAFITTYSKDYEDKHIETIIIQPVKL